jgi:hypothetical protein
VGVLGDTDAEGFLKLPKDVPNTIEYKGKTICVFPTSKARLGVRTDFILTHVQ